MADDLMSQLLTAGAGTLAGGGVSAIAVRFLFASFKEQLTELATTVKDAVEKNDERHEKHVGELATMKAAIDAAHRRLDELSARRRR
jgi:hypothetical protein